MIVVSAELPSKLTGHALERVAAIVLNCWLQADCEPARVSRIT